MCNWEIQSSDRHKKCRSSRGLQEINMPVFDRRRPGNARHAPPIRTERYSGPRRNTGHVYEPLNQLDSGKQAVAEKQKVQLHILICPSSVLLVDFKSAVKRFG
ncbi:Hypothetical protein NTJ_05195 [Nesidiocoris tenuis]|uniref:Uncharacterized protein n=1 Tax=Nesidiocoris tenuis TaxID=355587 RepID=A0ABN7AJD9_9HEMI|nr:Hypothetical protein NTJ_05195 [Nesidiocoris tenuis]